MATISNTHAPLGAVSILRVVDTVIAAEKAVIRWNQKRITRKELSRLSDRQLDDVGLCRADLYDL
ncbi:DUF1127 domain-containing protein [Epibacterium sp. SM1969]|uniref:DUF1127 domain-containing protein n=1 Tax=Tritonibacter aquimaris TaxID=2663379 RepID=A0A844AV94_9RHOB|nr:DUF1127 domain-containing protein [Tritonibacter aquimaris]MQY41842.1 DUF1127 domain-containing protein [Tritonibacter aquimaris]